MRGDVRASEGEEEATLLEGDEVGDDDGHERWQMIGFLVVQTGMIGSMGSVGVHDKAQAIATIIIVAATVTPPQFLAFGMMSLGLESQADM